MGKVPPSATGGVKEMLREGFQSEVYLSLNQKNEKSPRVCVYVLRGGR